jgi:hypothetical protein
MGAGITNSKKDTTYVQQYNRLTINLKKQPFARWEFIHSCHFQPTLVHL